MQIELPSYRSELITQDYFMRGSFRPIGPMLPFMNDDGRKFIQLNEASLTALDASNPLTKLTPSAVMVNKVDIIALCILDQAGIDAAQLFATKHKMIVYTAGFIIQGYLHMGTDDLPLDIMSGGKSTFMGMTDTSLYSLKTIQTSLQPKAKMMLINRSSIILYHIADGA